ncbi:MAG: signal peptidase II [Chloroflexi bacterium]|nr:signal peptidase II [Chloroflexota bacterium]
MQSSTSKGSSGKAIQLGGLWALLISVSIVFADQLTKSWIRANLQVGQSVIDLGFLRITNISNAGAAFGLFPDYSLFLTIFSLLGVTALVILILASHKVVLLKDSLSRLALGLVAGGTAGNLLDRFMRGYVTDFIDFGFWPAFNIADSAISIGTVLIVLLAIRMARATGS